MASQREKRKPKKHRKVTPEHKARALRLLKLVGREPQPIGFCELYSSL